MAPVCSARYDVLAKVGELAVDVVEIVNFEGAVWLAKDGVAATVGEIAVGVGIAEVPVEIVGLGKVVLGLE